MIKIAVTNLRRYNEGDLVFEWIDLPFYDFNDLFARIGQDEYFISDYECEIASIHIYEYTQISALNELAEQLENLSEYELLVVRAICEVHTSNLREAIEIVSNENYLFYEVEDMDELIDIFIEEGNFGEIPSNIRNYLDYEKIARDLEFDGFITSSVGVINIS